MNNALLKVIFAVSALLGAASTAHAHGSMKPQHGGMVQLSGETVVEFVLGPKGADVYLTDEDQPLPSADFAAKLVQTAAGKKSEVALKPVGGNRLSAPGFKAHKGARVVISLTDKAGTRSFATFQPR